MTDKTDTPEPPAEPEQPVPPQEEPPVAPIPAPSPGASRDFGPTWTGGQDVDTDAAAKDGTVEALVGVYPGSVVDAAVVAADGTAVPLEDVTAEPVGDDHPIAGIARVTGRFQGPDGPVRLRVRINE